MNIEIKKILEKIENNGFEAYIVGGFVRDGLIGRGTTDIDICTNAVPKEIQAIFGVTKDSSNYGSFTIKTNTFSYDITTYREECNYEKRVPTYINYTNNLLIDLKRRDFTMNAICMNQKNEIIDLLNGVEDIQNKTIRCIGNIKEKIKEDPLRILRAIRFSCVLDFKIETELWEEIKKSAQNVLTLSDYRMKQELDNILISKNFQKGFDLLEESGILEYLTITKKKLTYVEDLSGMWAQIIMDRKLTFTKNEEKQIKSIAEIINYGKIDEFILYTKGLYVSEVANKILKGNHNDLINMYEKMPLHHEKDLNIKYEDIKNITKKDPKECNQIRKQIIEAILKKHLENKFESILNYIKEIEG